MLNAKMTITIPKSNLDKQFYQMWLNISHKNTYFRPKVINKDTFKMFLFPYYMLEEAFRREVLSWLEIQQMETPVGTVYSLGGLTQHNLSFDPPSSSRKCLATPNSNFKLIMKLLESELRLHQNS